MGLLSRFRFNFDCSNCQVRFVQIEPCLNKLTRTCQMCVGARFIAPNRHQSRETDGLRVGAGVVDVGRWGPLWAPAVPFSCRRAWATRLPPPMTARHALLSRPYAPG